MGKNHGNPQTAEYTMGEEYNNEDTQRQRPLALLLRHTRRLQLRQRPHTHTLSFSLSLSHAVSVHTRYTTTYNNMFNNHMNVCPKSYLYIYDFRVIYIFVLPNRSDRSEPGHRNRVFGLPVLPNFHPEGPVSQH